MPPLPPETGVPAPRSRRVDDSLRLRPATPGFGNAKKQKSRCPKPYRQL